MTLITAATGTDLSHTAVAVWLDRLRIRAVNGGSRQTLDALT
jgi:hypothetical protein